MVQLASVAQATGPGRQVIRLAEISQRILHNPGTATRATDGCQQLGGEYPLCPVSALGAGFFWGCAGVSFSGVAKIRIFFICPT
jgi:hypothetical protein